MAEGSVPQFQGVSAWAEEISSVRWLAGKFGVQPWTVLCAGCLWACGFVLWGFTGEIVCTFVGLMYPMYGSFKALEDGDHEEVGVWLTYWVTYAALKMLEASFYHVLEWVPFYHLVRLLFLVWLFMPLTRGASWIYKLLIGPALRLYRPHIDSKLDKTADDISSSLGNEQFRRALSKATVNAAVAGAGYVQGLGIEDLVEQQLLKAAAGFGQAPPRHAQNAEGFASGPTPCRAPASGPTCRTPGSRARVASPAPREMHQDQDSQQAMS